MFPAYQIKEIQDVISAGGWFNHPAKEGERAGAELNIPHPPAILFVPVVICCSFQPDPDGYGRHVTERIIKNVQKLVRTPGDCQSMV